MAEPLKPARQCVCKHLRSKEMYYSDRPMQLGPYDSGIFWCHLTQKGLGPDGVFADIEECQPTRSCFED